MLNKAKTAWNRVVNDNPDLRRPGHRPEGTESNEHLATHRQIRPGVTILETGLEIVVCAAQQKTGASAAALAMLEAEALVCRARVGSIAPDLGMTLNAKEGITGTCVRTRETLNCADAEKDSLVDSSVCRALGIRSVLVGPIIDGGIVVGVLEVLSSKPNAFDSSHVEWLHELTTFVRTLRGLTALSVPETQVSRERAETEGENTQKQGCQLLADGQQREQDVEELNRIFEVLQRSSPTATWEQICRAASDS